jgi:hypothetical protein
MPDRRHADVFEILGCQLRQNCFVDRVLAECRLVLSEAKAPQPTSEFHDWPPETRHHTEKACPGPWLPKTTMGLRRALALRKLNDGFCDHNPTDLPLFRAAGFGASPSP